MRVDGTTRVVAVLGDPVGHSRSPAMHNPALHKLGLNWIYVPFRVCAPDLGRAVEGLRALHFAGANVTIPHKERVLAFLDELSDEARTIGAVNTIINRDGRLFGATTDPHGIRMALKNSRVPLRRTRAVILGTGGSARTALFTLLSGGCPEVTVAGRRPRAAAALARWAGRSFTGRVRGLALGGAEFEHAVREAGLLVNATPVGLSPRAGETPVQRRLLHPGLVVFDMVYNPLQTRLLREARAAGAKTVSGIEMLIHQGLRSFALWTGKKASEAVFRRGALGNA